MTTTTRVFRGEIYMTPSHSLGLKIEVRRKQRAIIFHGNRVIVNFVSKFVVLATRVGRRKILMTPSNSLGPKIGE